MDHVVRILCHRCKNDLATVANLLALRAGFASDPLELAHSMERRIAALSAVYSHRAGPVGDMNLRGLCREVWQRAQNPGEAVRVSTTDLPDLDLSLRLASPLALWLYEVFDNALEHGAASLLQSGLELNSGWRQDQLYLRVRDWGPGLAPGFDLERDAGAGLKVAQAVALYDLGGRMDLTNAHPGLKVELFVPAREIDHLNQMECGAKPAHGA